MNNTKSKKTNIFNVIKMDMEYKILKSLFAVDKDVTINENKCIQRLIFVLKIYQKWIHFQQQHTSNIIIPNMRDIINNELHKNYDLDAFLSDYRFVIYSKRDAFGYFDDGNDELNQFECNVSN
eukprot:521002_1